MQRLERALRDLAEQDNAIATLDLIAGVEERLSREGPPLVVPVSPRRRRPLGVAVAAGAAAILLVGAIPFILGLIGDSDDPADVAPSVTTPTTAPTTDGAVPEPTPEPTTDITAPPATTAPVAQEPRFDYATQGNAAGELETVLGTLSWYTLRSVPYTWIEAGFPGPSRSKPERDFWQIWSEAHSGLEVFDVGNGYLGLGDTSAPDESRIMLGYRNNLVRVRGVATREEVEQRDAEQGIGGMELWADGRWWDWEHGTFYPFTPTEVWFSEDGSAWEQLEAAAFDADVVVLSQPGSVARRGDDWMIIGWDGVTDFATVADPSVYVAGAPKAWMSGDLMRWTEIPLEFGSTAEGAFLESVAAGDEGWMIVEHNHPIGDGATATSVWLSPDGSAWEQLDISELTGIDGCPPWQLIGRDEVCVLGAEVAFVPGGVAIYVVHTTGNAATQRAETGWTLWVGVLGN